MATNYKNILLKDNNGQVLLPITLSYYVEYKDGTSVRSYLDTLGSKLGYVNGNIDGINTSIGEIKETVNQQGTTQQNLINTVNNIIASYVSKPDYAYAVVFDNTTNNSLSDSLKNLKAVEGSSYVSTQQAIEAIDARVTSTYSYTNELGGKIDRLGEDITQLDTTVQGLSGRVNKVETKTDYAYTKVNTLFGSDGNLDLTASSIKYTGTPDAGTDSLTGNDANVQKAIDLIGSNLKKVQTDIDGVITQAGVSSITGYNGILVDNISGTPGKGAVSVKLNLDNDKLSLNKDGAITVVDSALSITASQISDKIKPSQIEGGLDANNINITYSYMEGDVEHADGKKSVQTFYNEYETKIKDLEAASKAETLDSKYKINIETPTSEEFAKVYRIKQGSSTVDINIPKDQFLKKVEYVDAAHAPADAQEGDYPALVFTWNLSDADETTGAPTSIVPIASFVDAITSGVVKDVTALKTDVETLKTSVSEIQSSYITGATVNGQAVNVVDHVLQLSYNILYESGTLSEGISEGFLRDNGIILS